MSPYALPPLTSVHNPADELGQLAATAMLQLLRGEKTRADVPAPRVIVRESTRPLSGAPQEPVGLEPPRSSWLPMRAPSLRFEAASAVARHLTDLRVAHAQFQGHALGALWHISLPPFRPPAAHADA